MRFRSEEEQVRWLRRRLPRIGDDAAFVAFEHPVAVSSDTQAEGVHFPTALAPELIARRLLRVNLSDLAASGAEPRYATCCLLTTRDFEIIRFFEALIEECRSFGVELIGGDTTTSSVGVSCSLTVFGELPTGAMLERSAAEPGDELWLTGQTGRAALGWRLQELGARMEANGRVSLAALSTPKSGESTKPARDLARRCVAAHRLPEPRLTTGRQLARLKADGHRVAAIDISDGLLKDSERLAAASSVRVVLQHRALQPSDAVEHLAVAFGVDPWEFIASGGEDYELLFTLPEGVEAPQGSLRVGRIVSLAGTDRTGGETPARDLVTFDQTPEAIARAAAAPGWDHFTRAVRNADR